MKEKPDVVVAFAFGAFLAREIFYSPNYWIAMAARKIARTYQIPIVTQKDIFLFFDEKNRKKIKIFNIQKDSRKYIPTLQIAKATARLAQRYGWKKAIVIAAPPHKYRAERDVKKCGFEFEVEQYLFQKNRYCRWFHPSSVQLWTRSPWLWWPREILLRLMPWWMYKCVAG